MSEILPILFPVLAISIALTAVLFLCVRLKLPAWALLLVGVLPVLLTYACNPNMRVYSAHGFMHTSIVYEILNGNFPPTNPLLAGEKLLYPWGHHALTAVVCAVGQVSPPIAFTTINVITLGLTLLLVYRSAGLLGYDRTAQVFAAVLAVFGFSIFNRGPLAHLLYHLPRPDYLATVDALGMPPLVKFLNTNGMPLGILCFALFLYSLIGVVSDPTRPWRWRLGLAGSVWFSGLLYPFTFLPIFACCVTSCLVLLVWKRRAALANVLNIAIPAVCGALLALPYLLFISSGKVATAKPVMVNLDFHSLLSSGARYLLTVLPLSVVLLKERAALVNLVRSRPEASWLLIVVTITTALMFLWIPPELNQYKFLVVSCVATGILSGVCLGELFRKNVAVSLALLVAFLLPASTDLFDKWRCESQPIADGYFLHGKYMGHSDPWKQEFYEWISTHTPTDSVFLDSERSIPVFARRRLYLAVDGPPPPMVGNELPADGWQAATDIILRRVNGYDPRLLLKRHEILDEVLSEDCCPLADETFLEIAQVHPQEHVYVVARTPGLRAKYEEDPRFRRLFDNRCAAIFGLRDYAKSSSSGR